ncbi:MAG: response regulator [Opitutaceae bacterium]|nr:response regulator [Opitutaceae bacterium]
MSSLLLHQAHVSRSVKRVQEANWDILKERVAFVQNLSEPGRTLTEADKKAIQAVAEQLAAARVASESELDSFPTPIPFLLLAAGLLVAGGAPFFAFKQAQQAEARQRELGALAEQRVDEARRAGEAAVAAEKKKAQADRGRLNDTLNRLEMLSSILDTVPVVIWAIDSDGNYLLREGRSLRDAGVESGDGVGRHFSQVSAARPGPDETLRRALTGEAFSAEYREGDRWYNTRFAPLSLADGTLAGVCGVSADITHRKRAEALALQEEGIRNAARLKSEFMANMSHELRTPMNGIVGMVGLLGSTELSEEQQGMLDVIQSSTDSLLKTVNDLIDLSKLETGKVKLAEVEFKPGELVRGLVGTQAVLANKKGVELITDFDSSCRGGVIGDPDRVCQLVANLLDNAVKFTAKGHVLVQMRVAPAEAGMQNLCITISDTGVGIEPARLPALLRPYGGDSASVARRVGDVGFGLSIGKMIVGLMGGTLSLTSEVGRGATATVLLPMRPGAAPQAIAGNLAGKRLLVVDDSEVMRGILALKLSAFGAQVDVSEGAQAALSACVDRAARDPYHAVLVDRFMPKVDGAAFASLLRAERELATLPLILLSPAVEPLEASKRSLFQAELAKPVDEVELVEVLQQVVSPRGTRKETVASTPVATGASQSACLRILVADDNAVNQVVCRRMLEKLGNSVKVVSNGREVLEATARERFDAIFMDCQMPDIDGYEATRRIRADIGPLSKIWIVAVTANASAADRENCFSAGMNDFIPKPLHISVVEAALGRFARTMSL